MRQRLHPVPRTQRTMRCERGPAAPSIGSATGSPLVIRDPQPGALTTQPSHSGTITTATTSPQPLLPFPFSPDLTMVTL